MRILLSVQRQEADKTKEAYFNSLNAVSANLGIPFSFVAILKHEIMVVSLKEKQFPFDPRENLSFVFC